MQPARVVSGRSLSRNIKRQRGQALIYGIFMLVSSLVGLFFLFNTGQLVGEKTKLVNTADAVAYSAGVMHARALNFDAYNNRALVANEVLVAQMVSLSSWAQYAKMHVEEVPNKFPECQNYYGAAAGALLNYDPLYAVMCYIISYPQNPIVPIVQQIGNYVPPVAQAAVSAVEINKGAIKAAESWLHSADNFTKARADVMQQVADRNYAGDGAVAVHAVVTSNGGALGDPFNNFVKRYTGDERTRIAEVSAVAAASDKFVDSRKWTSKAVLPLTTSLCFGKKNSVERRGGTSLVGLDQWKSEDTESAWQWKKKSGFLSFKCKHEEDEVSWGEQRDYPSGQEEDASGAKLGGSPTDNPKAHGQASSNAWENYTGMPAFYDLSPAMQNDSDPRLRFTVRLTRNATAVRTSDGASTIPASPRLNKFSTDLAGGVMSAMATSEVYFERPWFNHGNDSYTSGVTSYRVTRNQSLPDTAPETREIGSLFNPYWHVRLAANNAVDIVAQQAAQGSVIAP
ncbi:MAG: pilus assembly protein TadG-related protein [Pseudomonadota bacterium]